jgi:hypothetical protein
MRHGAAGECLLGDPGGRLLMPYGYMQRIFYSLGFEERLRILQDISAHPQVA